MSVDFHGLKLTLLTVQPIFHCGPTQSCQQMADASEAVTDLQLFLQYFIVFGPSGE